MIFTILVNDQIQALAVPFGVVPCAPIEVESQAPYLHWLCIEVLCFYHVRNGVRRSQVG